MTMKLTAKRFNTRRKQREVPEAEQMDKLFAETGDGLDFAAPDRPPAPKGDRVGVTPEELEAVSRESLTGRQLRIARRVATRHNINAASDLEAVILLRRAGVDPFQRGAMMDLVSSREGEDVSGDGKVQLPQRIKPIQVPSTEQRAEESHLSELIRIQRDIARRRRRQLALLGARLAFFVLLPTIIAGYYYYVIATPLYSAKSEFVIQQADNPVASGGLGGMLRGTALATSQDSIVVQGYLQSREAMERLDHDLGFRAHFSAPTIDALQRLPEDATREDLYSAYKRNVKIAYDPTEGIMKMEVIAEDPASAVGFSEALIGYAEEQVDQMTQRMREDQMAGARAGYDDAENKVTESQQRVVDLQEQFQMLSSEAEASLITTQIGSLEAEILQDRLAVAQMESNPTPNTARLEPLKARIARMQQEVVNLRGQLTQGQNGNVSLARVQSQLLMAQADVTMRQELLATALAAMETARVEATRQTRYLSRSVNPTEPDEAIYPRAFENTLVAMLIFMGIYLMISMTTAILREQVSS